LSKNLKMARMEARKGRKLEKGKMKRNQDQKKTGRS